jgi:hypothetical protein
VVAVAASVAINLVARLIALAILPIPADNYQLGTAGPTATLTICGAIGAIAVFAVVRRRAHRAATVFTRIAAVVLLVSFIPDVLLLTHHTKGTTLVSVMVLMFLHVVAAVTITTTLIRLGLPARHME